MSFRYMLLMLNSSSQSTIQPSVKVPTNKEYTMKITCMNHVISNARLLPIIPESVTQLPPLSIVQTATTQDDPTKIKCADNVADICCSAY